MTNGNAFYKIYEFDATMMIIKMMMMMMMMIINTNFCSHRDHVEAGASLPEPAAIVCRQRRQRTLLHDRFQICKVAR